MRRAVYAVLVLVVASAARADSPSGSDVASPPWRLAVGSAFGTVAFDPDLDNFRWDTRPALQSGAQVALYRGRAAAAIRLWRASTTQDTGIPGMEVVPRVNLTGVDVVGQWRVATYRGVELWSSAYGGWLHLGYDPDALDVATGGAGGVTRVSFESIGEWNLGAGVEVRRQLTRQIALGLQAEGSSFALDTAHRSGSNIIETRERFYSWNLRLQVSWLLNLS